MVRLRRAFSGESSCRVSARTHTSCYVLCIGPLLVDSPSVGTGEISRCLAARRGRMAVTGTSVKCNGELRRRFPVCSWTIQPPLSSTHKRRGHLGQKHMFQNFKKLIVAVVACFPRAKSPCWQIEPFGNAVDCSSSRVANCSSHPFCEGFNGSCRRCRCCSYSRLGVSLPCWCESVA